MKESFFLFIVAVFLGCDDTPKIKGHIYYSDKGKGFRMISSQNPLLYRTSIYPDVIDFTYDDNFTLVKQVPTVNTSAWLIGDELYSVFTGYKYAIEKNLKDSTILNSYNKWAFTLFASRNASDSNTSRDLKIKKIIADSLIKNDPDFTRIFSESENFWIILNKHDRLIGPLKKDEYLKTRRDLGVPEKLHLKSENE